VKSSEFATYTSEGSTVFTRPGRNAAYIYGC